MSNELTDEQIDLIANDGCRNAAGGIYATRVYEFARAIEQAARAALSDAAQAPEPDCWAILTPNGSRLVSPEEAKGRRDAYPLYAAPVAPQEAVDTARAPKPTRYFVYDPENGLEEYATDQEREKAHAEAIEPDLDDGWSEEVENVVSGVITHVTLKNTIAPNPGHTNCSCDECNEYREAGGTDEWSEICNYHAAPVAPAAPNGLDWRSRQ